MRTTFGLGWEAADTKKKKMSWSSQALLGVKEKEEDGAILAQVFSVFSKVSANRRIHPQGLG